MVVDVTQEFDVIKAGNEYLEQMFSMDDFDLDQINEAVKLIPNDYCAQIDRFFLEESGGLTKMGVSTSKVSNSAKEIVKVAKTEGVNSESKKKIQNIISRLFEDIAHDVAYKKIIENDKVKEIPRTKVKSAIVLLLWVLLINTIATSVLMLIAGQIGVNIGICVVAPVIEESAKQISIKGKFEKEFYVVFNVFEASSYVARTIPTILSGAITGSAKEAILGILRARGAAAGMHAVTTAIHKIFESEKVWKKLNIKDEKEAKDMATLIAFIIGILLHSSWNAAGTFSKKFTKAITGTDAFAPVGNSE